MSTYQHSAPFLQQYIENAWKLVRLYDVIFEKQLVKYQLTKSEKDVLLFLHNNPEFRTASDVVRHRGISKSLVSESLDALELRDLVERIPWEQDRRYNHVFLTEKAAPILKELVATQQQFRRELRADFTEEEFQTLMDLTRRMTKNLEESLGRYE